MRTMNTKELLNTLPVIQTQFDALLNFNVRALEILLKNTGKWLCLTVGGRRNFFKSWWSLMTLLFNVQANPDELTNGIIHAAFLLLFKDSLRLFAAYNEGILNLLGKLRNAHDSFFFFNKQTILYCQTFNYTECLYRHYS